MIRMLARTSVFITTAVLFTLGVIWQKADTSFAAPTSLLLIQEDTAASGPTIPPGPWDDDDSAGESKVASGPTIPPGPWDDDDSAGETKVASGPTIPPGPWDDDDSAGESKFA